jgi:hypothetical protein
MVSFDLGLPELVIAGQRLAATMTAVPEAAIQEDSNSLFREHEIRPTV